MRLRSIMFCASWLAQCAVVAPCAAQQATTPTVPTTDMDAVVVAGSQPGPGMWKVSKDDHVLWILGTVSPLPTNAQWKPDEVRGVLDQADEVLAMPTVSINPEVGLFRGLLLLPSIKQAMNNPDGKSLRDVLPADTYARWATMKQRYIGRDSGIEKKRPFLAAQELYSAALKRSGLGGKIVSPVVDEVLKRRGMTYTPTGLKFAIKDPKAALADFRKESLEAKEVACIDETMDGIEREMPQTVALANAWAVGDLDALRALAGKEKKSCWSAWADTEALGKRGLRDVETQLKAQWLKVAEASLQKNRVTFAMLRMAELFKPDGYLAALQAKGYAVEAPE